MRPRRPRAFRRAPRGPQLEEQLREHGLTLRHYPQWLDSETTRALAFVARRLGADSVGLVFASREIVEELESASPELHLGGLSAADSRALLDSVLIGHLDGSVRDRFLAETHGNPLALIELPRSLTSAEAATGIARQSRDSLTARIEDELQTSAASRSPTTRDSGCFSRRPSRSAIRSCSSALRARLGLSVESADPAEEAGLFQIRERCSFRHPLVRSAVYGAATPRERRLAHSALAEATDAEARPGSEGVASRSGNAGSRRGGARPSSSKQLPAPRRAAASPRQEPFSSAPPC